MKSYGTLLALLVVFLSVLVSCKKTDGGNTEEPYYSIDSAYVLNNISYGTDPQQVMDIYMPSGRSGATTKVFVLIHGGGWSAGDKADYTSTFNSLKTYYPNHAVINLNYRLGTSSNPGYPKQINDIQAALNEIQKSKYNVAKQYLLYGGSAGGHLSMLYAYAFDEERYVKGVINTVGPADLTDTAYLNNPAYLGIFSALVGNAAYAHQQNTALFNEVSPVKQVTQNSPPTLSFYGNQDPLIPASQLGLLRNALDAKGVYHVDTMYAGAGHGNWNVEQSQDFLNKTIAFIDRFFQ